MPPKKKSKAAKERAPRSKARKTKLDIPKDGDGGGGGGGSGGSGGGDGAGTSASLAMVKQKLMHMSEEQRVQLNFSLDMGSTKVVNADEDTEYVVLESMVKWAQVADPEVAMRWQVAEPVAGLVRVTAKPTLPSSLVQMFKEFVENARDQFFREFGKCTTIQVGVCMHPEFGAGLYVRNDGNGIPMSFIEYKGKQMRQADVALRIGVSSNYDAKQKMSCAGAHGRGGSIPPLASRLTRVFTIRVEESDKMLQTRAEEEAGWAQQIAELEAKGEIKDVIRQVKRTHKTAHRKGKEYAKILTYDMVEQGMKVVNRSYKEIPAKDLEDDGPYTLIQWWPDWTSRAFDLTDAPEKYRENPDTILLQPDAILQLQHSYIQTMCALTDSMRGAGGKDATDEWRAKLPATLRKKPAVLEFTHPGTLALNSSSGSGSDSDDDCDSDVEMEMEEKEEEAWRVPWHPRTMEAYIRCWGHAENPSMPLYCVAEKDVKSDRWSRMRVWVFKCDTDNWPRSRPRMNGIINGVNVPGGTLTDWVRKNLLKTVAPVIGDSSEKVLDHFGVFINANIDEATYGEQIKNTLTSTNYGFKPVFSGPDTDKLKSKTDPLMMVVSQIYSMQKAAAAQATRVASKIKTSRTGKLLSQEDFNKKVSNIAEGRGVALATEHPFLQPVQWHAEGFSAQGNCTTAIASTQLSEDGSHVLRMLVRKGANAAWKMLQSKGKETDAGRLKIAKGMLKKCAPGFDRKGKKGSKNSDASVNQVLANILAWDETKIPLEKGMNTQIVFGGFFRHTIMGLKGVIRNWATSNDAERKANAELQLIMQQLGIDPKHVYPRDEKKLLHTYVGAMMDQDQDGAHIMELLIANVIAINITLLYARPDLFKVFITPVLRMGIKAAGEKHIAKVKDSGVHVVCVENKYTALFYSLAEYEQWKKRTDFPDTWFLPPAYTKGLGTLPVPMIQYLFAEGRNVLTISFDAEWTAITRDGETYSRPDEYLLMDSEDLVEECDRKKKKVFKAPSPVKTVEELEGEGESEGEDEDEEEEDDDVVMVDEKSDAEKKREATLTALMSTQVKAMDKLAKSSAAAMAILESGTEKPMDKSVRLVQQMTQDTKGGTKEFRRMLLGIHNDDDYIDIARCRSKGYVIPVRDIMYSWVLAWGKGTIARCFPCIYSGLKNVEMRLLTLAICGWWKPARDGYDGLLIMNIRAALPNITLYDHGPVNVPVERLTQVFSGVMLVIAWIVGKGNLGSRESAQSWAQDRYTHAAPDMEVINAIFGKRDFYIVPWAFSQGKFMHPMYLLGPVPLSLINGTSAVAFAYASRVLPRCPFAVHAATVVLQTKFLEAFTTLWEAKHGKEKYWLTDASGAYMMRPELCTTEAQALAKALSCDEFTAACKDLYPHFPFNTSSLHVANGQITAVGQYTVEKSEDHEADGSWDVHVTELPPERYVMDVKSAAMKPDKAGKRVAMAFRSQDIAYKTSFKVRISGDTYTALTKKKAVMPCGRIIHPDLVAKLKLSTRFNTKEQNYITEDERVVHVKHPKQVFTIWAHKRLETYQERRKYELACANADVKRECSRYAWIKAIVMEKIRTNMRSEKQIVKDIVAYNAAAAAASLEEEDEEEEEEEGAGQDKDWIIASEEELQKPESPHKRMGGMIAKVVEVEAEGGGGGSEAEGESESSSSYDYLLRMPIRSLTKKGMLAAWEKYLKLLRNAQNIVEEPIGVTWEQELVEWEKVVRKYRAKKEEAFKYEPGRAEYDVKKARAIFGADEEEKA